MFLQLDFTRPTPIDRIRLDHTPDQHAVRLRAEGRTPQGQWLTLAAESTPGGLAPPLDLRRQAIAELRRLGVTHILTSLGDQLWDDFEKSPHLWGIRQIAAVDGARLYRLE